MNNNKPLKKVFLTGRDFINWAIDDDYFFTKQVLEPSVLITNNLAEAEVIHSVTWHALLEIDKTILKNKFVISHIPHDVRNMLSQPEYLQIAPYVNYWAVPSQKAKSYMDLLSLPNIFVPYGIDFLTFNQIPNMDLIEQIKSKYNIPCDKYLIGSFQRDTEGVDLITPKLIKGPDLFLEIVKNVYKTNQNIHVILAGPRRFWLRRKLEEENIPYTFIGEDISGRDDLNDNTINQTTINILYNLIDLYIVSSRREGGPKAILECVATRTKIISTNVGHAPDILEVGQIYTTLQEAVKMVLDDIDSNNLQQYITRNFLVAQNHTPQKIQDIWMTFYCNELPKKTNNTSVYFKEIRPLKRTIWRFFKKKSNCNEITIYFQFQKPPWGGGNQFLMALSKTMQRKGWIVNNSLDKFNDFLLFNSFHISTGLLKKMNRNNRVLIHRIDGPTFLVRGKDKDLDDDVFKINNEVANVSIFQSEWSLMETLKMGYRPVNPVLIINACDSEIFNSNNKKEFKSGHKIRLISTSWSDNPRKGGSIYKWLDQNLDWDRFEYTFVGKLSETVENIKVIAPVPSEELSTFLKEHDIYITASDNDPCSNALIEALSSGLPTVYFNRGGHSELVGFGGLGFEIKEEIPDLLNIIVENYGSFKNLINAPHLEMVSDKYIQCFNLFK